MPNVVLLAPFGKEKTWAELKARAEWEREQAKDIVCEYLRLGHLRTAVAYDDLAYLLLRGQ